MLKSHVKFNSIAGKRLILIVDDEAVNREMLKFMVQDDYDVLLAADGREAMRLIRQNAQFLSLILLDINMPVMDGFEVIEAVKNDEKLVEIPIIVLTTEEDAEVKSLEMGVWDFIKKPFDLPQVVLTRMQRTIELHEDRSIIQSTERDEMTGLFNKEYFYRYGEQFDKYHAELPMDAVSLDINHFHLINELYGRQKGNEVLIHLAEYLKNLREQTNCIVSRIEADKFFIYVPDGTLDYGTVSRDVNSHFDEFHDINVRIRTGVYLNVDKDIDIERRFDRAVQASGMIKDNYSRTVAYYDAAIHEKKIFEDRLLTEVDDALERGQFHVNYQPKYNITGHQPVLASAEVLARWKHPYLGRISPGVFVPLLENNGLIQKLDSYIWDEAMKAVGQWKKEGIHVPVSINVSRMDLYNSRLIEHLEERMEENGLDKSDLYLEITESSYTEDVDQIAQVVDRMHEAGFTIEMDDFGSGYSSLNMLADMPVDVLKMDMKFIQNLRNNDRQEILIRLVMDIAKHLGITVIAEGVEDKEQADFLKEVQCDIIQGYYYSKPLAEEDFEQLLRRR